MVSDLYYCKHVLTTLSPLRRKHLLKLGSSKMEQSSKNRKKGVLNVFWPVLKFKCILIYFGYFNLFKLSEMS